MSRFAPRRLPETVSPLGQRPIHRKRDSAFDPFSHLPPFVRSLLVNLLTQRSLLMSRILPGRLPETASPPSQRPIHPERRGAGAGRQVRQRGRVRARAGQRSRNGSRGRLPAGASGGLFREGGQE